MFCGSQQCKGGEYPEGERGREFRPDGDGVVRSGSWFWQQERAKKQLEAELRQQASEVLEQDEREQQQEVLWQAADQLAAEREYAPEMMK